MRIRPLFEHQASHVQLPPRAPYRYQGLASTKTIRLLKLHPAQRESDEIRCSLEQHDLSRAPLYHSLSYTWGYPLTPFSRTSASFSFRRLDYLRRRAALRPSAPVSSLLLHRSKTGLGLTLSPDNSLGDHSPCFPITCDGRSLLVTANLYDALHMLRRKAAGDGGGGGGGGMSDPAAGYYWIDAICIDQTNIHERNSQVALMADIFQTSQGVITWLGAEDQFTGDALTTIQRVSAIPRTSWRTVRYTDFFHGNWHQVAGVERITYHNWLGFLAFINRPWFRRAWVVQELALARSTLFVCGSTSIPWSDLDETLAFIRAKRWYHHLSTDKMRHIRALQKDPGIYRDFLKSRTDFRVGTFALASTRRLVVTHERPLVSPPLSLGRLMQVHRETEAKDPRDKVYAFLGIANRGGSPPPPPPPQPGSNPSAGAADTADTAAVVAEHDELTEPDYELPVGEVYKRVAIRLLLTYNDLRLLSHVQDASATQLKGLLPSWVPDFSVNIAPYPLAFRTFPTSWRASGGGLRWTPDRDALQRGLLHLRGFRAGTVAETASMPDEAAGSAAYWAGVVALASRLETAWYPTATGCRPQTRFEALWRTLVTDTYARQNPAPAATGRLFVEYVLNLQIRHALTPWTMTTAVPDGDGGSGGSSSDCFHPHQHFGPDSTDDEGDDDHAAVPDWRGLLAAEPPRSPCGADVYRERMAAVMEEALHGRYSAVGLAQLQHELDIASGSMRRVFRTANGLLGTGPRSVLPGDEVWVLAGANIPMVLRGDGGERKRLVGEAYVHGMMHFDATVQRTWSDVVLE